MAAAIVLHNIPEGMATYVASYHSVTSGLPLAIAIAIHNVPEGLAVRFLVITPSRHRHPRPARGPTGRHAALLTLPLPLPRYPCPNSSPHPQNVIPYE